MYWAGYFEGTKNTNTCPENSIPIKTEQECRDASSALGVSFKASGEFSSSAKGCSLVHTSDVYWNTHSTGSPNVREGPICKGNYPLWFLKGVYVYFWIKPTYSRGTGSYKNAIVHFSTSEKNSKTHRGFDKMLVN